MNDRKHPKLLSFFLLFLLCACAPTLSSTAGSSSTKVNLPANPAMTSSPARKATPTRTPLLQFVTPKYTQTPTATNAPIKEWTPVAASLSQNGPWLAVYNSMDLWLGNTDGTGFTQLADSSTHTGHLYIAIAPHAGRLVYYYPPEDPSDIGRSVLDFSIVSLPSLSTRVLPLSNTSLNPSPSNKFGPPYANIFAALAQPNLFAWSPDGTILAYGSAQDGPSVDLYTYSTVSDSISRLTSGPSQAIDISWSPDGDYIVSAGAISMQYGVGGGNGPIIDALWAVRPDGSDLHTIQTYPHGSEAPPTLLGWVNNRAFVEYYSELGCGYRGLTFVNIETSSHYTLIPGAMGPLALNPKTGTALVLIPQIVNEYDYLPYCGTTPEPGVYLLSVFGSKPPMKVALDAPTSSDLFYYFSYWSPETGLFFLATKDRVYTINLSGNVKLTDIPNVFSSGAYPPNIPAIIPKLSPDGREWAIYSPNGLSIASSDHPIQNIFPGPVDDALWSPDGSALFFVSNSRIYRAAVGSYQSVELAGPIPTEDTSNEWQLSWVMP